MNSPVKRILVVDDDRFFARLYQEELSSRFSVDICCNVEDALAAFRSGAPYLAAVVDVMMPPPCGHEAETGNGCMTGIWIVKEVLREIESRNIAIILFTNTDPNRIVVACDAMKLPRDSVTVLHKLTMSAGSFPYFVERAIARANPDAIS